MRCCTPTCRKWTTYGFGSFFVVVGIVLVVWWGDIVQLIKDNEMNLGSDGTMEYSLWEETPVPMYIEFYLFNWTNYEEVVESNWTKPPDFKEVGPYTYAEKHFRKDVIFNDNRTVTYKTQRIWHYDPEKSSESLDAKITTFNPLVATVGAIVKYKHPIVKLGVNFIVHDKEATLTVTKTAREFIFDGYEDSLLHVLKKLRLRHVTIPFNKFAWFSERNESIEYDGVFNMFDGTDDVRKLGRFYSWNYENRIPYPSYCGQINGTSGELWYPVREDDFIQVFTPDACSTLTLNRKGTEKMYELEGHRFEGDGSLFDNGTLYPEMACFNTGDGLPSGVRNISACKFGSPSFISYPHFYLADPYYREAITGMHPNENEHSIIVSIEPETGIPLRAKVAAQINLRLEEIEGVTVLKNAKEYYIPEMWFKQYVTLSEGYASEAKLLLILPDIGVYLGYALIGLGGLLVIGMSIYIYVTFRKSRKDRLNSNKAF